MQYEFERRKYARDLIDFDTKFAKLFSGKPRTELNQDGVSHEEFLQYVFACFQLLQSPTCSHSAFQQFGGFTSGIGIRYGESPIVNTTHQLYAKNLVIGQRMPPQLLIRAADSRPVELQDLLPSDTRFKLLVFTGDSSGAAQQSKLERAAEEIQPWVNKYGSAIDIVSISSAKKANVRYNELPLVFRSHWSKYVRFLWNPSINLIDTFTVLQGFH